jgi:hypothetical protein
MRTLLVTLAVLALAGSAVAADGQPRRALTKKDQARALSIVLKRSDLGEGFVAQKRTNDDSIPKGARCGPLDESDLTVTGDADSPDFHLQNGSAFITVGSTAQVYRTLREANTSWNRGTSAQVATCLADIVRLSATAGRNVKVVSTSRRAFPDVTQKATAYRVVVSIAVGSQRVPVYVDVVILQRGRIQSGLLFSSIGAPVGQAEQVALARVVARRLASASVPRGPVA